MKNSSLWMAFCILMTIMGCIFIVLSLWDLTTKHDLYAVVVYMACGIICLSAALLSYFNLGGPRDVTTH